MAPAARPHHLKLELTLLWKQDIPFLFPSIENQVAVQRIAAPGAPARCKREPGVGSIQGERQLQLPFKHVPDWNAAMQEQPTLAHRISRSEYVFVETRTSCCVSPRSKLHQRPCEGVVPIEPDTFNL